MVLIIGGEGSGKRSFARSLGYDLSQIADGVLDARPAICHVEQLVFADPDAALDLLPRLLEKELVLCDEVGSGVIPVTRTERLGREATGRLCILLAQQASAVVRMVCGIPTVIRGSLPCV